LSSNALNIISFPFVNYDFSRIWNMTEPALLGETELRYLIFCNITQAEFSTTIILQCTMNNNSSNRYDARWSDKPPIQKP
jgi:hypothetical protein